MPIIPIILIVLVTLAYVLRFLRPFGNALEGEIFLVRLVPLIARMRMHVVPFVVGTTWAAVLVGTTRMPVWTMVVPISAFVLLLAVPISYTLTSEGVRLGYGTFRRWTEFAGAIRYRGGAKLQGANGRRGMRIWLSGGLGDDEFLLVLRRAIRDAYKGGNHGRVIAFSPEGLPTDEHSAFKVTA